MRIIDEDIYCHYDGCARKFTFVQIFIKMCTFVQIITNISAQVNTKSTIKIRKTLFQSMPAVVG